MKIEDQKLPPSVPYMEEWADFLKQLIEEMKDEGVLDEQGFMLSKKSPPPDTYRVELIQHGDSARCLVSSLRVTNEFPAEMFYLLKDSFLKQSGLVQTLANEEMFTGTKKLIDSISYVEKKPTLDSQQKMFHVVFDHGKEEKWLIAPGNRFSRTDMSDRPIQWAKNEAICLFVLNGLDKFEMKKSDDLSL